MVFGGAARMPFNNQSGRFERVWNFVDQRETGDDITRTDLDVMANDLANGITDVAALHLQYVGEWNPEIASFPASRPTGARILARDAFVVTADGTVGGIDFEAGETLVALVPDPGQTYAARWLRLPFLSLPAMMSVADAAQGYADAAAAAAAVLASMAMNEDNTFVVETAGVTFPLAFDPGDHKLLLTVNGVVQTYGVHYTVAGDDVTFSEALRVGDRVSYLMPRPIPFDEGNRADFDTRASFIAANLPEPVNTAVVEGRVWVADADGPITANNGRTWRPAGVVTPGDFGAPGNNVALDTPALLEWADYVARVAKVGYVDKIYRCSAELDFTQGETVAASGITIYGDSDEGCEIQWQRMGCEKFWMKFNWMGSTADSADVTLRNWRARGYYTTLTKDTSCGVMAINNQRWKIENFRVQYHGSCGIYATRSFNSDLLNVKITEGGTQYLERTDLLAVDIVDGDVNFSVADGSLSAADVGRVVAIDDAVEAYPQLSDGYMVNRIASVLSSTTGTFETAPTATNTDCAMVFGRVRFSATNGSDVVTLSSDCLDADDLGRFVWLPNAGSQGHTLHSVIVEIIAADQCRLGVAASRTTEGDFTTSVALHVGKQPDEYTSQPSPYVNDIEMSAIQIEGYNGAAIYVARGDHVYFSQVKTHGRTFDAGVNLSGPAFINDARNVTVHQWHCEFNGCSPDEAVIVCCGPLYGITFTDTTVAGNPNNSWFAQHCEAVSTTQFINLNGLQSRIRWDKMKGIFKRQAGQFNGTSGNLWDIDADGGNAFGTFVAPRQYGDMRLWAESSKLRVLDADPAAADSGSMMFHQGNVLGPVSQSSGVPTGAIIERDANGDGAYIKFADGTLICWHTQTVNLTIATGLHGGFRSGGQIWNYPAEFASAEVVVTATVRSSTAFGANATPDSTTRCLWQVTAVTTQAAADRTVSLMAIGRWF